MNRFVRAETSNNNAKPSNQKESKDYKEGLDAREFYESIIRNDGLREIQQLKQIEKSELVSRGNQSTTVENLKTVGRLTDQPDEDRATGEFVRLQIKQKNQERTRRKNNFFRFLGNGNINGVREILSLENDWINTTDDYGWTPMMCAVASGNTCMVELLLDMKADVYELKDHGGQNAWDIAIKLDKPDIIELLFDRRVKKEPQYDEGEDIATEEHCMTCNATFCEDCQMNISSSEMKNHFSSTAHLFNVFKKNEGPSQYYLATNNIGYRMLKDAGWSEEIGLGRDGRGSRQPVSTILKSDRSGIGLDKKGRKRVTHFKANDVTAIRAKKRDKDDSKFFLKKKRFSRQIKSKQWEINLRSYMASD